MNNNHEKSRVNSLIPEFIKASSVELVKFLKEYYENEYDKEFFKTRDSNEDYVDVASSLIESITKNRDLDRVSESVFIEELAQTVAKNVPASSVTTRKFLIKRLVDYYDVRGNTRMVDAFFRLFFNKEVTVFEPFTRVLIPSSGGYQANLFVRTFNNTNNNANTLVGKRVFQKTPSGVIVAQGLISSVKIELFDEVITKLVFQPFTISGTFKSKFDIEDEDGNTYGKPYRTLESITITNGGSNYKLGDRVFLNDKIVSTFFARVASVQDGKVKRLRITEYGSGNSQDSSITETLKDFVVTDESLPQDRIFVSHGDGGNPNYSGTYQFDSSENVWYNSTNTSATDGAKGYFFFSDTASRWQFGSTNANAKATGDTATNAFLNPSMDKATGFWSINTNSNWTAGNSTVESQAEKMSFTTNFSSVITDLDTNGDGTGLKVSLNFDLLINEDGRYTDTKGRLSDDTVIQDSDFFQKFSYELSTDEEFSRYKSFYLDLLHPAGEKPFHNTRKTLPTQSNQVTNEEVTIKEIATVDITTDLEPINIPQTVFLIKQDYFNIDSTEPNSPLGVDKPYIKEDYLVTSVKITE